MSADPLGGSVQSLSSAHDLTGLTQVRSNYGLIGTGQTVAVIDSGIAWDHFALGGGLGSSYRVVGGWDFTEENDANPYDDGPAGLHGTHVAGVIGADRVGTADDGVAPGVDLVALRVINDNGDTYFTWVESALQWVHQNRNAFANPITAVNLSLGAAWNSTSVPSWSTIEDELAQLEADGIFISVSAGDDFTTYNQPGLSYPAASPYVVPVMSVDDNGQLSYFSQRHTSAIGAPGRLIDSTVPDYAGDQNGVADDFATLSGTSFSAPYVAGASVLVREAMEFVGYTGITQDTVYDHLMATANSLYDSATSQWYKRINMANAIDALMPADDYGSTVATAYDLGTIGGGGPSGTNIDGVIGTLTDVDYFTFTAGSSGTVSFTAATTHYLTAAWTAVGGTGTVSGANGEVFTVDVVNGQTYSVGLATSDGIGHYDLDIASNSGFSYVNWGTITQSQVNNVSISGEAWYRLVPSQSGYLTTEAFFASGGGNISLSLHNSSQQLLASGTSVTGGQRIDYVAGAGVEYFLKVQGTNADVDFRLTNLVAVNGAAAAVAGTSQADTYTFVAGAAQHSISVNSVTYQFNATNVTSIQFNGGAGNDSITMTGTSGDETATLLVGSATLQGAGYTATATAIENVTVNSNGGTDIANMYDSTGDDVFKAWSDHAELTGTGFGTYVTGFGRVDGIASTGSDQAFLYDTSGNDLFRGYSDRVVLSGTGYLNRALGFDAAEGIASTGNDQAQLYDSAGDDLFEAYTDRAILTGSGFTYTAFNFDQADGFASTGNDQAILHDSAGDDVLATYEDRAVLIGSGYFNRAYYFDQTEVIATTGYDYATLFDSAGDDQFDAYFDHSILTVNGRVFQTTNFDRANAVASSGNDVAVLYDSAGDDRYYSFGYRATMIGDDYLTGAWYFDEVDGSASNGYDFAILYDTAGDDLFQAYPDRAIMSTGGYINRALNFDRADGFASSGNDTAVFFDSAGDDLLETFATRAEMSGAGYWNRALYFDLTQSYSAAGNDTAKLYGSTGDDFYDVWIDRAEIHGTGFRHEAIGFGYTVAYGRGGYDLANFYDSAGDDLVHVRSWGSDIFYGPIRYAFTDFDELIATSQNGGNDVADFQAVDYLFSLIGNWN